MAKPKKTQAAKNATRKAYQEKKKLENAPKVKARLDKCMDSPDTIKFTNKSGEKVCRKKPFADKEKRAKLLRQSRANCPADMEVPEGQMCVAKTFKPLKAKGLKDMDKKIKSAVKRLNRENGERKIGFGWEPLTKTVTKTVVNKDGVASKKSVEINVLSRSPNAKGVRLVKKRDPETRKIVIDPVTNKPVKVPKLKHKGWIIGTSVGTPEDLFKKGKEQRRKAFDTFKSKVGLAQVGREVLSRQHAIMKGTDGKLSPEYKVGNRWKAELGKAMKDYHDKVVESKRSEPDISEQERAIKVRKALNL